jgi:multicomponent K+:H+ antiporter subunit E
MKPRWFAHPVLSLLLAAAWLLLQQSAAPAQLITAAVLGLVIPRLLHGFLGEAVQVRGWGAWAVALRLAALVLWDIVVANFTVARLVLSPTRRPQPAWVVVPLEVQHPSAISLLATIITMTPGTVSCVVDAPRGQILVHALDCSDVAAAAADMKARYEAPLKEIFG